MLHVIHSFSTISLQFSKVLKLPHSEKDLNCNEKVRNYVKYYYGTVLD